jgi:hypothetical protein
LQRENGDVDQLARYPADALQGQAGADVGGEGFVLLIFVSIVLLLQVGLKESVFAGWGSLVVGENRHHMG